MKKPILFTCGVLFAVAYIYYGWHVANAVESILKSSVAWWVSTILWLGVPTLLVHSDDLKNKKRRHKNILDDDF